MKKASFFLTVFLLSYLGSGSSYAEFMDDIKEMLNKKQLKILKKQHKDFDKKKTAHDLVEMKLQKGLIEESRVADIDDERLLSKEKKESIQRKNKKSKKRMKAIIKKLRQKHDKEIKKRMKETEDSMKETEDSMKKFKKIQ